MLVLVSAFIVIRRQYDDSFWNCRLNLLDKEEVIKAIPEKLLHDLHGSAEYRQFVLENMLEEILRTLKEVG